jgi:hypothetical protein
MTETGGVIRLRKGAGGLLALGDQPLIPRSRPDNHVEMVVAQTTCAEIEHATVERSQAIHGDRPMSAKSGTERIPRQPSPGLGKIFEAEVATTGSGGQQRKRRI